MLEEPFATGDTLFHRRDPRVKLLGASAISLVLALTSSVTSAMAGCLFTAVLLLLSRPNPALLVRRIAKVNIFILFLLITLPLTYGGAETFHWQIFHFSKDGLQLAGLIALKSNAILFCFLALLATSSTASLGHALERLGLPRKLIFLLLFSYRQLFVIHQEYQRLARAAQLRGFSPSNSLHTYRTYSHLFGMTLVRSYLRAERIHQAMILRGFNGRLIPLNQPSPDRKDLLLLLILSLFCLLLLLPALIPISL